MMFLKRWGLRCAIAVSLLYLTFFLAGCIGPGYPLTAPRNHAGNLDFDKALASLERSSLKGQKRNRLLYLMEKGLLLRFACDYRGSNDIFEEADRLSDELYTLSLSAEGISFLVNEKIVPYAGEDYEYVYINYYKLLNYIGLDDFEGALVECRRLDEKLNYLSDKLGKGAPHRAAPFLRLLTGLVYETTGDFNNAFIAYRKSFEGYRIYSGQDGVTLPRSLYGRLAYTSQRSGLVDEYRMLVKGVTLSPDDSGGGPMVAVLVEQGFIPLKREVYVVVPTDKGFPVKLAVPEFEGDGNKLLLPSVSLDGGRYVSAEEVENVAFLARESLAEKMARVMARAVARAVAKQVAARQAEKEWGPLAGLTAQVAALLTEQADLRSWTLLPEGISLALVQSPLKGEDIHIRWDGKDRAYAAPKGEGDISFVTGRFF